MAKTGTEVSLSPRDVPKAWGLGMGMRLSAGDRTMKLNEVLMWE
ncbi:MULTISPECIES: hypothetical protein [Oscillatoriales]|nr:MULTISPECIES: hypothetical protein [Oscillatoriales]